MTFVALLIQIDDHYCSVTAASRFSYRQLKTENQPHARTVSRIRVVHLAIVPGRLHQQCFVDTEVKTELGKLQFIQCIRGTTYTNFTGVIDNDFA